MAKKRKSNKSVLDAFKNIKIEQPRGKWELIGEALIKGLCKSLDNPEVAQALGEAVGHYAFEKYEKYRYPTEEQSKNLFFYDKIDLKNGSHTNLPRKCAIYLFVRSNENNLFLPLIDMKYVGKTCDLKRRIFEHISKKPELRDARLYYQTYDPPLSEQDLSRREVEMIAQFEPKMNKTRGGNGKKKFEHVDSSTY